MPDTSVVHAEGLDHVVVAHTAISDVDGAAGRLVLAGRSLAQMFDIGLEDAAASLWAASGSPVDGGPASVRAALGDARAAAHRALELRRSGWIGLPVMDALRAAIAGLDDRAGAVELVATVAVATAMAVAARRGRPIPVPDPRLGHAHDLLRMLGGGDDPSGARALERYLVTVADHGMNASTFAARVVASTGSDRVSAIVAALGALKGPLHGGAPGPVLDMLDAIGSAERAEAWLAGELAAGRRIMGMGHRVYRVRDPRAAALEQALVELERGRPASPRLALAHAVEATATRLLAARHPGRPLAANVEFYTAVLLEALGIDREAFTAVFACGRVVGWCAHVDEQRRSGRLIRPQSRYVGPRAA